ncbi:cytosine-specific methyltransferase [Galliscardovia ingluviei]|uniref:Cytosine-specific methyltransferase n=1 Tax=Galliscardovia ingluviei TaxID=1769422 RepID=A0A8J3AKT6_9BIFI|nr:DNA cytosine methyltransferase [Galliscardovia ingluviei]GGI12536.1 cytosine-specific methyltransferase [Galliscardovia ingluviei]
MVQSNTPNFIELFAGCGGLSLGLRSVGFHESMANELSSMPAETFALNLMNIDMRSTTFQQTEIKERKVLWINPSSDDVLERLVDNPFERPETNISELSSTDDFDGKLIVGDIRRLNKFIENRGEPLIHGEVDLVSGGPPCQSFSLAGRRELGNQRNQLPWEFAKFVNSQRPRMVLLENVEGILRPFKEGDVTYYAWFEVCKAFANIGYVTCPMLVNARFAGVAQNRPRFIMLAIREDLINNLDDNTLIWFEQGRRLIKEVKNNNPAFDKALWAYWDLTNTDSNKAQNSLFEPLVAFRDTERQHSVFDAICDLQDENPAPLSEYVHNINSTFSDYLEGGSKEMKNLRHPNSTPKVKARFRLYQIIANSSKSIGDEIKKIMRKQQSTISELTYQVLAKADLLYYEDKLPKTPEQMVGYLQGLATRKFSQRALISNLPAPAALSIPDDVAHYCEPRTLSVREMARIQSFPDTFEFRGIATTGGERRRYQVPQYTQIGNAVPPLLGRALGKVVKSILLELKK